MCLILSHAWALLFQIVIRRQASIWNRTIHSFHNRTQNILIPTYDILYCRRSWAQAQAWTDLSNPAIRSGCVSYVVDRRTQLIDEHTLLVISHAGHHSYWIMHVKQYIQGSWLFILVSFDNELIVKYGKQCLAHGFVILRLLHILVALCTLPLL